jgi:hypothetical protein
VQHSWGNRTPVSAALNAALQLQQQHKELAELVSRDYGSLSIRLSATSLPVVYSMCQRVLSSYKATWTFTWPDSCLLSRPLHQVSKNSTALLFLHG